MNPSNDIYEYTDFDKVDTFYDITGLLVNESPLKIGSGTKDKLGTVDISLLKIPIVTSNGDIKEVPYIPGSSLKGLLRYEASLIRASLLKDNLLDPVKEDIKKEEVEEIEKSDPIIGIFGGKTYASHIIVFDAYPVNPDKPDEITDVKIIYKTRTAINRIVGSVQPKALLTEELVAPGTTFKLRMRLYLDLEDKDDPRVKILLGLFKKILSEGLMVGGGKSIGYGLVRVKDNELKYLKYKLENGEYKTESGSVSELF